MTITRAPPPGRHEPGEVRQEEPPALALLRMELGAVQLTRTTSAGSGGRTHCAVARLPPKRGETSGVIRMHEAEVRPRDPASSGSVPSCQSRFQPMCGTLSPGETGAPPRAGCRAPGVPELLALGEEELIAETDAEYGRRPRWAGSGRRARAARGSHRVRESAVPGDDQCLGARHRPGLIGHDHIGPELGERLSHAAEVAPAVVDDRDHKAPLVESTPSMRGFSRDASARARPNALNSASAMWWRFSP